ncbi:tetratricopeptide (TPR) repeat protein [Microbacterium halimionae]|uniref:Tetratricopeptide (TPR) repeat protein n=1 Tax=Microbacterium halimionae TaxID=1526413 RepID=A0A7W3JN69_9MICO|nr:tetratricopeptide repeat protein [Microbacterium halimionae]MBA8815961.1 tetratricopeptide (TPR) repeat protein [Microbacterium halimionae]NII96164.1 tetratricopeptide (TPR) repeat protein [Microbacterium halimionae]
MSLSWQERIDAVWADAALNDVERIAAIDRVAAERDESDPVALFERGGARDSAGVEQDAVAFYRRALKAGLPELQRVQASIQLASTLRNLGDVTESIRLLQAERQTAHRHGLADAVEAFYALALASDGRPAEAASVALAALSPHLPQYSRSVRAYADELRSPTREI